MESFKENSPEATESQDSDTISEIARLANCIIDRVRNSYPSGAESEIKNITVSTPENCEETKNYLEGHALAFTSEEARVEFEDGLLENAGPTALGYFGNACWRQFYREHPDWTKEDDDEACLDSWCGGGFYTLPTVEFLKGGTILFCSKKQLSSLENAPWICKAGIPDENVYVATDTIDYVVALDDETVEGIEKRAAEKIKENGGKLLAVDGWEVPLSKNQKPRVIETNE